MRLATVESLWLAILEFANLRLVLLDELLILVSLFDAWVLVLLLALPDNTFRFEHVIVDVARYILVHVLNLLHFAFLELFLSS